MIRDNRFGSLPMPATESLGIATRRELLNIAGGAIGAVVANSFLLSSEVRGKEASTSAISQQGFECHGLSAFGDLELEPNFPHFPYVNPDAPVGGELIIRETSGIDTFNTLNPFILQGDAAAGMGSTFDSLMVASADEPDAIYGLVAQSVWISADRCTYRFKLRPEARFHDGSPITAEDVVFSFDILREKGLPVYRTMLIGAAEAKAEANNIVTFHLLKNHSRELPLLIATLPILSKAYWRERDFAASTLEPPLGSGPYRVGRFEPGRFIEFDRVDNYWARSLNVNVGQNNFDKIRYEYFRDDQVMFEAFKSGIINFHEEYTASRWANGYNFAALRDGRVKRELLEAKSPPNIQGWYFNTRRSKFTDPRVREAIGLAFDFEWTNTKIMHSAHKRTVSFFENTPLKAEGLPSPEELTLLEPFRDQLPEAVFGEPYVPPVSDGSGYDRDNLRRAHQLLQESGLQRDGHILRFPDGMPFEIEFLSADARLEPHTQPLRANLRRLGIKATSRIVDPAQYQERLRSYDFDITSLARRSGLTPGAELRLFYGSESARTPGTLNVAGINNPIIDALIEYIVLARTREEITIAARALDRVLRAGHYWIPHWFLPYNRFAYWDIFSHPDRQPRYSSGAPDTWWFDAEKAKRIGWKD